MNLIEFKKEQREKYKDLGKKLVINNDLEVKLHPMKKGYAKSDYYTSMVYEFEDKLYFKNLGKKGSTRDNETLVQLITFWKEYAEAKKLEKIIIPYRFFIDKEFVRNHQIRLKEIQIIEALGFETKETENGDKKNEKYFVVEIKNYRQFKQITDKIKQIFEKKLEKEQTMILRKMHPLGSAVIYKTKIDWFGHKAEITISYKDNIVITDSTGIKITVKKEEVLESAVQEYFEKIEKKRKVKNVFEPPHTHLTRFIVAKSSSLARTKGLDIMKFMIGLGYTNEEVEQFCLDQMTNRSHNSSIMLGNIYKESLIKILNHYLYIEETKNHEIYFRIFKTKEEIGEECERRAIENLKKKISSKLENLK